MPEHYSPMPDDLEAPAASPLHGFRGDFGEDRPTLPISLTVAISREAGARGGSIAKRAGAKLGWQVYTQDLLEYVTQQAAARQEVLDGLPQNAAEWVEGQLNRLQRAQTLSNNPSVVDLARVVLFLAAQGEAILVGRGAGCILPSRSTLHVRLVAPIEDRVAYLSQVLRLTEQEAAEEARRLDHHRAEFVTAHFHRKPTDVHQYDLLLNSSLLGEERCADLIVHAAQAKLAAMHQ